MHRHTQFWPWLRLYLKPDDEGGAGEGGAGGGDAGAKGADAGKAADAGGKASDAGAKAGGDTGKVADAGKGADPGKPAFDWNAFADGLKDDSHKTYAKNFKGPEDLLAGALNLRKEISTRIKVPGKDAAPEDVAAFRKAIGAREKPEEYKAALPENYEMGEVQTALLGAMQKAAAETGVPAASFESFTKTYFEFEKQVQEQVAAEVDQYRRDMEVSLKKEFGADYDKLTRAAKQFVDQRLQVPEFSALLEETVTWNGVKMQLGSHPAVVKMLAQIGLRTAEDGVIGMRSETETKGLKDQISALERQHPIGQRTREQDAQIRALYEKLYN